MSPQRERLPPAWPMLRLSPRSGLRSLAAALEAALPRARAALDAWHEHGEDAARLALLAELRLLSGALTICRLPVVTALVAQMRDVVGDLAAEREPPAADAAAARGALAEALLRLEDHLDRLQQGAPDRRAALQAAFAALQPHLSQPAQAELALVNGVLAAREPAADAPATADPSAARRLLPAFQAAFLHWFRHLPGDGALRRIEDIAQTLAEQTQASALRECWRATAALAQQLREAAGAVAEPELPMKRLLGRVGTLLKTQAEAGEAEAMARLGDLLPALALALAREPAPTASAAAMLEALGAAQWQAVPDTAPAVAAGPRVVAVLLAELQAEFASIKDAVDLAARGIDARSAGLADAERRLGQLAAVLATLDLPAAAATLADLRAQLQAGPVEAPAWQGFADALLACEHGLEPALRRRQAGLPVAAMAAAVSEREQAQARRLVLREAQAVLASLIAAITPAALPALRAPLQAMASAVRLLRDEAAADALAALARVLRAEPLPALATTTRDRLVEALAGVERLLAVLADDRGGYEGGPEIALLHAQSAALEAALAAAPAARASAADGPRTAPMPSVDPELRAIFLEEARAVCSELQQLLPAWAQRLEDRERLSALRRAFHTLKGSGRMVGARGIGLLAAHHERLFAAALEGRFGALRPLHARAETAIAALPALLTEFEHGEAESAEALALAEQAETLLQALQRLPEPTSDDEPEASADESPDAPPAAAESAAPASSAALRAVFIADARERLAMLQAWLADASASTGIDEAVAAFHTLQGSAAIVAAESVRAIAAPLEHILQTPPAAAGLADAGWRSTLAALVARLAQALEAFAEQRAFTAPDLEALLARLAAGPAPLRESAAAAAPAHESGDAASAVSQAESARVPDEALAEVFAAEAGELLEQLDLAFEAWRNGDAVLAPLRIQRVLHTLKGSARVAGLETTGDLAHELESHVDRLLGASEFPEPADFTALQRLFESLHAQHDALCRGERVAPAALPSLAEAVAPAAAKQTPAGDAAPAWAEGLFWTPPPSAGESGGSAETARVAVGALETLLDHAGELAIQRSRLEEQQASLRTQLGEMAQTIARLREQLRQLDIETDAQIAARGLIAPAPGAEPERETPDFDPLEMDRYSRMQELSRALAESVGDLGSLQLSLDDGAAGTEALLQQQGRLAHEVQQGLMATLMVPFARQAPRLQRVVRLAAEEHGREAQLQIEGAEALLDRKVLERLTAPLEHLLRNAVIHGIEPPDTRRAAGKPPVGQIRVQLRRDGAQLSVEISDDGAGLDHAAIRAKAIARGLMPAEATLSDEALARFIFEPGFSTAARLTQDAGRGIGMDVVASTVRQLGGTLALQSAAGVGTRLQLLLPLSLAVSQALLVAVGEEIYALPLARIEGVGRIARSDCDALLASEAPLHRHGDEDYRLRTLAGYLGLPPWPVGEARSLSLILTGAAEGLGGERVARTALVVDRVIGNREIVSRAPGPQLGAVPGVAGATILGDGRVVVILDLPALLLEAERRARLGATVAVSGEVQAARMPAVLVVDDSITMRRVAERLLTRHGYRVQTARDGLDAMAQLQAEPPDAVLLDIEMPRADGFEVAAFMRNNARLASVPIVMITSRSGDKHRERARSLGVDRYLVKPYREETLLLEIDVLCRRSV